jgi:hypothetical protein
MYIPIRNIAKRGRDFIPLTYSLGTSGTIRPYGNPLLKAPDHPGLVSRIEMASVSPVAVRNSTTYVLSSPYRGRRTWQSTMRPRRPRP